MRTRFDHETLVRREARRRLEEEAAFREWERMLLGTGNTREERDFQIHRSRILRDRAFSLYRLCWGNELPHLCHLGISDVILLGCESEPERRAA